MMKKLKASIISLGCARNLVDSELIMGKLKASGIGVCDCPDSSDIVIVNTCAFIEDAKKESIDTILKAVALKAQGIVKKIIVCGCFAQRYLNQLRRQIPEVDAILGVDNFKNIHKAIEFIKAGEKFIAVNPPDVIYSHKDPRIIMTPSHYAYIKIAEGCRNHCSYCAIYKIRGDIKSRTFESIISEIKSITKKKKKSELNIIAQDTTSYGIDNYKEKALAKLLVKICRLNRAHWIRILYAHPKYFSGRLIDVIAKEDSICKYIDLPVQHISDKILLRMNRSVNRRQVEALIKKIRKSIPNVALRTSVIVGFPGESQKDFKQLLDFIKSVEFDRLGAFVYSREEGTPAWKFKNQISEAVKKERFDMVMRLQQDISNKVNSRLLNKTLEVLVEEKHKKGTYSGRTQYDAPEVDGMVHISSVRPLSIGDFVKVKVTDTLEYDLVGNVID